MKLAQTTTKPTHRTITHSDTSPVRYACHTSSSLLRAKKDHAINQKVSELRSAVKHLQMSTCEPAETSALESQIILLKRAVSTLADAVSEEIESLYSHQQMLQAQVAYLTQQAKQPEQLSTMQASLDLSSGGDRDIKRLIGTLRDILQNTCLQVSQHQLEIARIS